QEADESSGQSTGTADPTDVAGNCREGDGHGKRWPNSRKPRGNYRETLAGLCYVPHFQSIGVGRFYRTRLSTLVIGVCRSSAPLLVLSLWITQCSSCIKVPVVV